jgi:hypothetical protein
MHGAEIAGRFAIAPNSLSYCGKGGFGGIFGRYMKAKTASNRVAVENAIKHFRAHYSYLQLISKATGRKPFDAKVCEAFWLGNELLDEVDAADLRKLICSKFAGKGLLSARKAAKIAKSVPAGAVAHHSFHPLFIGSITGVVGRSAKNSDMCRPSWGKVITILGNSAVIDSQELVQNNGKLALVPARKIVKLGCAEMQLAGVPKVGEIIASHWGFAVMKISMVQSAELEEATKKNVQTANKDGFWQNKP